MAAVEAAMIMPVIVVLFFGAVDAGNFANCYQKVVDASREGARAASRSSASKVSEVEASVLKYLGDMFPNVSDTQLISATKVTVRDSAGNPISGSNLEGTTTGDQVEVEVTLQFNTVRSIVALPILTGWNVQAATTMRRE